MELKWISIVSTLLLILKNYIMKELKLKNLSESKLNSKQMKNINGGETTKHTCGCGCLYAGEGGSSTTDNLHANIKADKFSGDSGGVYFITDGKFFDILGNPV